MTQHPAFPAWPNLQKRGLRIVGLDATPTGSTDVTIADFTGATSVNIARNAALFPITEWVTRADSQTAGLVLTLLRPGWYTIRFTVAATAANRVNAGILIGGAAPPANPVLDTASPPRVLATSDYLGAAGEFSTKTIFADFFLADADIDGTGVFNVVRFMLSNAAGLAAPTAGLVLAQCGVEVHWGPILQSAA